MQLIDLFCGAGGLSLGLERAGIRSIAGVDSDQDSIETFRRAHHGSIGICDDAIRAIDGPCKDLMPGPKSSDIVILAGGPPCQGFCSINPGRHIDDPRNSCVDTFLYGCEVLNPDFVLIENVTGLLSLAKGEAINKIVRRLEALNYFVNYMVLQAAHYGAPQNRWRLIVAGSKRKKFEFPEPTHFSEIKPNVAGGKKLTFSTKNGSDLNDGYQAPVTVWDAISDLPKIANGEGKTEAKYSRKANTEFQLASRAMGGILYNHQAQRLGEVNMQRIVHIGEGQNWQSIPDSIVPQNIKRSAEKWGRYTPTRFGRLSKSGQFTTILTKPEPYWGSFIHPTQDRLISAREAARAQCFPDSVYFAGNLSSQYRQVGNAVPIAIGRALGVEIMKHFQN